jgi:TRAP-type C4-dicarboxylate transport system permease small subunit
MVGRAIALVVILVAVGVFFWGYRPVYEDTWSRTMRALGWSEGYERVQPYYEAPASEVSPARPSGAATQG